MPGNFDSYTAASYDSLLMSDRLPKLVKPLDLSESGQTLSGSIPVADLDRLKPLLFNTTGEIDVSLEFGIDALNFKYVHGHLDTTLELVCQRCMQGVRYPVKIEFELGLVTSIEDGDLLPENYEPLLVKEKSISIYDVIEDEIMLALPIVPRHSEDTCHPDQVISKYMHHGDDQINSVIENKSSPFSVLSTLKKDRTQ